MDAIVVDHVSKIFRIFRGREDTLKGAFTRFFRSRVKPEEFWALRDISFSVTQGETFGIIGENGSGKSTLLKLLCGILRPNQGNISINGRVAALLELGAGFHPDLTGRENIYLNGSLLGFSKAQINKRFDEIVAFAELEEFIDTPIKHYSSGMYVRLGFAIAVNVDPDVLLIDEILAVGDEGFQRKCICRIEEFKKKRKTIILVTHNLGLVREYCERALLLQNGKPVCLGEADQIVSSYYSLIIPEQSSIEKNTIVESCEVQPSILKTHETQEITNIVDNLVTIRKVWIENIQGEVVKAIVFNSTVSIRMTVYFGIDVINPIFGFTLWSEEGVHLYDTNTRYRGFETGHINVGKAIEIIFQQPLPLLPGHYHITAAVAHSDAKSFYDKREHAIDFEVTGDVREKGIVAIRSRIYLDGKELPMLPTEKKDM